IVGVCVFTTRAASVVMPVVVKRFGEKRSITVACLVTISVLAGMYLFKQTNLIVWYLLSGMLGVSFSVATLGMKSFVGRTFDEQKRITAFSYLNVAVNIGAALGPIVGGFVMESRFYLLPLIALGSQVITLLFSFWLPQVPRVEDTSTSPEKQQLNMRIVPLKFVWFLLISSCTWLGYVQLYNVFPAFSKGYLDERLIGILFSVNAVVIIVLQIPISHFFEKVFSKGKMSQSMLLVLGNGFMAVSMVCFALVKTQSMVILVIGCMLFTVSELLWSPFYDAMVVQIRGKLDVVTALGISGFLWGLAESLGTSIGMLFVGNTHTGLLGVFPFVLGFVGASVVTVLGLFLKSSLFQQQKTSLG
ncbi:MAG: MFS transporter, partial [Tumebacillaceae bacterium]